MHKKPMNGTSRVVPAPTVVRATTPDGKPIGRAATRVEILTMQLAKARETILNQQRLINSLRIEKAKAEIRVGELEVVVMARNNEDFLEENDIADGAQLHKSIDGILHWVDRNLDDDDPAAAGIAAADKRGAEDTSDADTIDAAQES